MTLKTAIKRLEAWGCRVEPPDENHENCVTVLDSDGNSLHLTGTDDETTWILGKAYGLIDNDPTMMVDILDMAGEGEEDYEEIMWPEEAEDEATS